MQVGLQEEVSYHRLSCVELGSFFVFFFAVNNFGVFLAGRQNRAGMRARARCLRSTTVVGMFSRNFAISSGPFGHVPNQEDRRAVPLAAVRPFANLII